MTKAPPLRPFMASTYKDERMRDHLDNNLVAVRWQVATDFEHVRRLRCCLCSVYPSDRLAS